MSRLQQLIHEIHRRSLWQVLLIYVGGAWICYEIIDTITDRLALPEWLPVLAIILFLIGLPVVMATAFVHEVAPPRVRPAEPTPLTEAEAAGVEAEAAAARREGRRRHRFLTWRNAGLSFMAALAVWGVVAAGWLLLGPSGDVVEEEFADAAPGIAVLPFSVHGEGLDMWREGMVNLLSTAMNGVGELRTIDSRTVLARWREQVPSAGEADRATAIEVAKAAGARYALLGSAVAIGQEVRLSADIYETENGAQMGSTVPVEGSLDSVWALVDRLAVQSLVVVLGQEASELPPVDLASVTTASIPALTAWLEAEALLRRGDFEAAIAAYERAVAADSTFALAFYGLGQAYSWSEGVSSDRYLEAFERAMRWVDRLPAREAALVRAVHAWQQWALREAEEVLQRLVRTYPDYAEAWYWLGDLYYHDGTAIPVSAEDVERCFTRAVELEPQHAPYRVHLIDMAFRIDPDSAHVDSLIADYKRLASADAIETRQIEFAFDLAFGDQEHRERALASLDTLDLRILRFAAWDPPLAHPRFWPQWEAVFLAKQRRVFGQPWQRWTTPALFGGAAMGRGYLRKALEYLDRPQATTFDRGCLPVDAHISGFPVPPDRLEEAAAVLSQIDSTSWSELVYCAALLAAAQGRWADHARAVELSWDVWRREVDAGRSGGIAKADALAVEAYGLWRQGDPEAALEKLEEVRRYQATDHVRRVLGQVLMDLERWEEAVPYLRAWPYYTYSYSHMHYHLGRAYEGMGDYGKAAKEYAFFVEAWEDADPELQPWVEDARRALERLAPDR
jgi:tetratricopeptide (TPR) repeat protein